MIILEENSKWHLEAFASELFIYSNIEFLLNCSLTLLFRENIPHLNVKYLQRLEFYFVFFSTTLVFAISNFSLN